MAKLDGSKELATADGLLDLSGPQFLLVYVAAIVVAAVVGILLRRRLTGPHGTEPNAPRLDPLQLAHLRGGPVAAVQTALVALQGVWLAGVTDGKFLRAEVADGGTRLFPSRFVGEVHAALDRQRSRSLRDLVGALREACEANAAPLRQRRLLVEPGRASRGRLLAALPMAVVLVLGIVRFVIGVGHDRPVSLLFVACAAALVGVILLAKRVHATGRGRRLLAAEQTERSALRTTAETDRSRLDAADLCLAVGVFGPAFLHGSPLGRALGAPKKNPTGSHGNSSCTPFIPGCGSCSGASASTSGGGDGDGGGGGSGCGGGGGGD